MAISKVKKAVFYIPSGVYESFLIKLKEISSVEIIYREKTYQKVHNDKFLNFDIQKIRDLKSKIETVLNVFSKYEFKVSTIEGENLKIIDFYIEKECKYFNEIYEEVVNIDTKIKKILSEVQFLENKINLLIPFKELKLSFNDAKNLKYIKFYFCKLPIKKFKEFINQINLTSNVEIIWTNRFKDEMFFVVSFFYKEENSLLDLIKKFEVNIYNLFDEIKENYVDREIENIEKKINLDRNEVSLLINNLRNICESTRNIGEVYMQCLEIEDFVSATRAAENTYYIKVLYCWVPEKFLSKVKELLKNFPDIISLFLQPEGDEDIPSVLHNKKTIEPYEFITKLYGYPKFGTTDPTSFLAPFFTIFFALCLSDIFYGILLTVLWLFIRKKVPKDSEYYGFVVLLKYLGIISIIIGFTMDSFLGFNIFKSYKLPINPALFDPLNKPIDMLKFTFLLGYVQVIFGLFLAVSKGVKDRDFLSAIDNFSWIIFITSFAPVVYQLFFPKEVNPVLVRISGKISLFMFLFIAFFQSRDIKPILLKPVSLFVKAYNTIGFYADMLSYSRILALALASSAIAQTINMLVAKLLKAELLGIKFLEPAIAPLLFLGGHLFNFAMGVLGGLVHSARLQYLEFFSKFFVSGGRPIKLFAPLKK